jgi:hypothetical protein
MTLKGLHQKIKGDLNMNNKEYNEAMREARRRIAMLRNSKAAEIQKLEIEIENMKALIAKKEAEYDALGEAFDTLLFD